MRKEKIVKVFRAGSVVVPVGVLVLASAVLTLSPGEANAKKDDAPAEQFVEAVRRSTTFGTLGIVDGQTVRLSAVRAGDDNPAALCKVDLNVFNTNGDPQGAGVSTDLQPRQAAIFDLSRAEIQGADPRAQIYAVVDVTSEDTKKDQSTCHVAMSIEIFDEDGRTQIYQGAFAAVFVPTNCCRICCVPTRTGGCRSGCGICVAFPDIPRCPSCNADGTCRF